MESIRLSDEQFKELRNRYLTDIIIHNLLHEIAVLYSISIPIGLRTVDGITTLMFSQEVEFEVRRARRIIGEIIESDYQELFI